MTPLLGIAAAHVLGAMVLSVANGSPLRHSLTRPTGAVVTLGILHLVSLGAVGYGVLAVGAAAAWALRPTEQSEQTRWPVLLSISLTMLVLARSASPTSWDELVWLGKARLESLGFGAGVQAALDPGAHVIPPGYPTLWPSAVGWLSLGRDALNTHTRAATLLVLLTTAVALHTWAPRIERRNLLALVAAFAAPLVWVHARSVYADLPVGLLGLALLGQLLSSRDGRVGLEPIATAVVLTGFKDEGLAHVLAATGAAVLAHGRLTTQWRRLLPAGVALATAVGWHWLLNRAQVVNTDHALALPYWPWVPKLAALLWLHATDIFSWGVFWAVAAVAALRGGSALPVRALRWLVLADLACIAIELLSGPERVRVFAENGTLVNRLLMQAWPAAAACVVAALSNSLPSTTAATER